MIIFLTEPLMAVSVFHNLILILSLIKIKHSQNFQLPDFVEVIDGNVPQFVVKEFSDKKGKKKTISKTAMISFLCIGVWSQTDKCDY